ncbi:uncharacterized protein C19orf44-like [Asterias rubens]|uniref:uncharacterized protein C19orf44-like n=1 Tax=Asterias rubens TaxID=7604 RepID=UPI0014554A79|nr:uncharacterized protein C19orf44-like [Asterias rubens]
MQRKFSNQPSVLERAQKQLQGKRLSATKRGPASADRSANQERRKEENDLDAYLSQLSRKVTISSGKKTKSTLSDDFSDISISSDGGQEVQAASLSASRFVKKSHSQTMVDSGSLRRKAEATSGGISMKKSATTPNFLNKTAPVYASSALQKAAKLGAKFSKQKRSTDNLPDSESDFDISLSDEDNLTSKNKTKFTKENMIGSSRKKSSGVGKASSFSHLQSSDEDELKKDGNKFLKKSNKPSFYVSESDGEDNNFGRDGNKFLKKSASKQSTNLPPKPDPEEEATSRFLKKPTSKTTLQDTKSTTSKAKINEDRFLTSTPKKEAVASSSKLPQKTSAGLGLDSDEEDLQEFIMNLSPSSSPDIPPIREKKQVTQSSNLTESKQTSPSRRPATPGVKKVFRAREDSSDNSAVSSESIVTESLQEDIFSGIHTNIMQLEDLEPIGISPKLAPVSSSKPKVSDKPNKDIVSNISEPSSIREDFLSGLQTVDDLLARDTYNQGRGSPARKNSYKSDFESAEDSISEILSNIRRSGSKTPREAYAEDTFTSQSVSLSQTNTSTRTIPDSQSEGTSGQDTSQGRRTYSDSGDTLTKASLSENYSDDFDSRHTDSDVEDLSSDDERMRTDSVTHSRSFTSYTESKTITRSETPRRSKRRDRDKKKTMKTQDASVQADGATSATHRWLRDLDLSALGTVTGVDPTPVAMHVINPQALEALTSYSPSILAMNEMLLSQIRHTQQTIQGSLHLHQTFMENIQTDYNYTTVEDTKEYIRRHRRPKLTMEQALAEVRREMEEGYR